MLSSLELGDGRNLGTVGGKIALDCSVRRTAQGHYVISTTDFFFPLVDSPYLQGRIGAANVLSDLYAEGVRRCDFVLMSLAVCLKMTKEARVRCTEEMVRGFRDACDEAGAPVTGGQTVLNPWPIIGGVATAVVAEGEFVPSDGAKVGHVVVLTKPLGTQVAVNVHQWQREWKRRSNNDDDNDDETSSSLSWNKCAGILTEETADDMVHAAIQSMARLNKNAGALMLTHGASAATDVTGFGILGHAQNLVENQKAAVGMELRALPLIKHTREINRAVFNFELTAGYSAETSGGLLVCLPEDRVQQYRDELERLDGCPTWIVGRLVADEERKAIIVEDVEYLEV